MINMDFEHLDPPEPTRSEQELIDEINTLIERIDELEYKCEVQGDMLNWMVQQLRENTLTNDRFTEYMDSLDLDIEAVEAY